MDERINDRHQQRQRQQQQQPPAASNIYVTLKPLIFFVFFSTIFMAVAVGILMLAILIVQLMLEK